MSTNQAEILTTDIPKDRFLFFGVKAVVNGNICLESPISTHTHGFKVSLFIEDGVYKISLLKIVVDSDTSKIKEIKNGLYSIYLTPEEKAYQSYIQLLQHIEAIAGFNYGITKILYQDTLELFWCIGDAVFNDLVRISIAKQQFKRPKLHLLSESKLSSITLLERVMPEAIIPYNFYREATNYLAKREYRLAYLHYYMILEYCFCDGNYSEKSQVSYYEKNLDINFAVLATIKLYKDNDSEQLNWLINLVKTRFHSFSLRNILTLLFRYRGEIAHGTKKCGEYSFDESVLANITHFIHQMCLTICGNMQVYCKAFTNCKETRLKKRLESCKEELKSVFDSPIKQ